MLDVGFAGEFRIVVSDKDGNIKQDTGYQKNLILNQGLEFFGGGKGSSINAYCVIGSGNSTPAITQTQLDVAVAITSGTNTTSDYSYVDKGDNLYRVWEQKQYRFEGLNNANISEVGLASQGNLTTHWLTTRALIKDSLGNPTTITVKTGEVLDIYYKIHKVIDTLDKSFVVNMLDGDGGNVPYNVIVRPYDVGTTSWRVSNSAVHGDWLYFAASGDLSAITSKPNYNSINTQLSETDSYVPNSYKIILKNSFRLVDATTGIRIYVTGRYRFITFQVRFGSVENDSPIPKTANHTLELPFEISWGRYEGEL